MNRQDEIAAEQLAAETTNIYDAVSVLRSLSGLTLGECREWAIRIIRAVEYRDTPLGKAYAANTPIGQAYR